MAPPHVPEAKERYHSSRLGWMGRVLLFEGHRVMIWLWTITEAAAALSASDLCPRGIRQLVLVPLTAPTIGALSPSFLAGICLIIAGSLLRRYCYRVLGQYFTFELSVRKSHELVTSGPYSVVRHPSYAGSVCVAVGEVLCCFDRNSWLVASSGLFPHDEIALIRMLWCLRVLALTLSKLMFVRMNNEDAMLEKAFGDEWKAWVERVPYRLVPGVY
ncbi:hypothetical protein SCLCIDRAFT_1219268 [Scleroderma citrinum Foug A]|uniref:Protein-S-isoprenylcysteine O-methyltransferase n=1 Tax=Scleroderma citrinum Foug A TaxID=1036808 RepID=A0A0C3DA66_9AGAM|nr:hypothetical protein SCLCIDRAFT_1219268 [Scleroderma citrinum Foug A]